MNSSVTRTNGWRSGRDGVVGFAVERPVVARIDQRPDLALFGGLAVDELQHVRMLDVKDDHLGGAARLAADDDTSEGVKPFMNDRAEAPPPPGCSRELRSDEKFVPVPSRCPNSMPSVLARPGCSPSCR